MQPVQKYLNVPFTLFESERQIWDDVFVVVEKFPEQLGVFFLVVGRHDLGEVVEDVKGPDVELVDGQDRGIAAHDEGEGAESRDPVRNPDGELFVEILGTSLQQGRNKNVSTVKKKFILQWKLTMMLLWLMEEYMIVAGVRRTEGWKQRAMNRIKFNFVTFN